MVSTLNMRPRSFQPTLPLRGATATACVSPPLIYNIAFFRGVRNHKKWSPPINHMANAVRNRREKSVCLQFAPQGPTAGRKTLRGVLLNTKGLRLRPVRRGRPPRWRNQYVSCAPPSLSFIPFMEMEVLEHINLLMLWKSRCQTIHRSQRHKILPYGYWPAGIKTTAICTSKLQQPAA